MSERLSNITIEGARIIFRNFAGEETKFNRAGSRNFCAIIEDPEMAQSLADDGWKIKQLQREDEEPVYYLPVTVSYRNKPPKIVLMTGNNRAMVGEDTVANLDYVDISNVDLEIAPYAWEVNGNSGIKAYLKTMYVQIEEDPFEGKYGDTPF